MSLIDLKLFGSSSRDIWVESSNVAYVESVNGDRCVIHFVGSNVDTASIAGSAEDVVTRLGGKGATRPASPADIVSIRPSDD
jgi:hypothetical protein